MEKIYYYIEASSSYLFWLIPHLQSKKINYKIEIGGVQLQISDEEFEQIKSLMQDFNIVPVKGILPSLSSKINSLFIVGEKTNV